MSLRPLASLLKRLPFCLNFANCLASPSLGVLVCTGGVRSTVRMQKILWNLCSSRQLDA